MSKQLTTIFKHRNFWAREDAKSLLSVGGAGSGKSQSAARYFIEKYLTEENIGILVTRKTMPSLRSSCYRLMRDILSEHNLPYNLNKASMEITHPTRNNRIEFRPLDDVEKIKSIEGINYIWIEEATEVKETDYKQLLLRMRNENHNVLPETISPIPKYARNKMICTFNPINPNSFLKEMTEHPNDETAVLHTTFRDNPFLTHDYRQHLENLVRDDAAFYKIYTLGQWAALENLVYADNKWKVIPNEGWPRRNHTTPELDPWSHSTGRLKAHWVHGFGLDFGYAHSKTALVEVWVNLDTRPIQTYVRLHIYENDLTNTQLIQKLGPIIYENSPEGVSDVLIIADSARPDLIQEIFNAGYNIRGCLKGKFSVKAGIDKIKRVHTNVTYDSPELATERSTYSWKTDAAGNVTDRVVKHNDDALDAERYVITELVKSVQFDMTQFGAISNIQEDEPAEIELTGDQRADMLIREKRWFQEMIESLPHAQKAGRLSVQATCREIIDRAGERGTPTFQAALEVLDAQRKSKVPIIRRRADDMYDVLITRSTIHVPRRGGVSGA